MLNESGEEDSIYHAFAALFKEIIKRAETTRATSSIIKSGLKDTEASIKDIFPMQIYTIKTLLHRYTDSYTVAPSRRRLPVTKQAWSATAILRGPFLQKKALFSETEKCYCFPCSSVIYHHLMFSTSYFKSSLFTISIKRVNAMPLRSNIDVVLKIMTIAELFIVITTATGESIVITW